MRIRRITAILLPALLLTLTSSILPLFLPARGLPERKARDPGNDPTLPTWELWFEQAPGRTTVAYWRKQVSGLNVSIPVADFERDKISLSELPSHLRPKSLADLDLFAIYTATGWPFRSMSCAAEDVSQSGKRRGNETWHISGGLLIQNRGNLPPRFLPLQPVWPGLLINTAIYAVAILMLASAARFVRRAARTRRGRCPTCGYSRTGLTPDNACPECGHQPLFLTANNRSPEQRA
jgi:hypothetical protein